MASPVILLPVREIGLVVLMALAIYLLLAIGSYSPLDPGLSFAGSDLTVSNWVGRSGAYTADVMLLAFGWAAYLVPVGFAWAGVQLLRRGVPDALSWPYLAIRVVGFLAVLVSLCVLSHLHFTAGESLPAGIGGAIGASVVEAGLPMLNWVGLTLCVLLVLLIGSQATLGHSWLAVVEATGRGVHVAALAIVAGTAYAGRALAKVGRAVWARWRLFAGRKARRAAQHGAVQASPPMPVSPSVPVLAPEPVVPSVAPAPARAESEPAQGVHIDVRKRPAPTLDAEQAAPAVPHRTFPTLELLEDYERNVSGGYSQESLQTMSRLLETKLADFRVDAEVVSVLPGPVVTRFELQPAAGVKVSKITGLAKDIARSLAVVSVRIVEIIPGKSVVGIEIPNEQRETVRLKEILDSGKFRSANSALTLALGKDIAGVPVMADIGKMPHLLVAGTTGSGKSVGINAMLLSMLYKATPADLRLILVDPKMLELAVYDGIPHLLTPVVTDMKDAAQALNWCVAEMERRYQLMAALGVRNLGGYNKRIAAAEQSGQPLFDPLWPEDAGEGAPPLEKLPFIVVVIDEFADMMMIVGKKVEQLIARIAQKARAAGIHLVLATQRPSVDVITGLIKANIPARISFQVSSKIDSRTVLDQGGAEQLLGHGDMLFLPPGTSMPIRVHGAFVSDEEVHAVAGDWKAKGAPDYVPDLLAGSPDPDVPGVLDLGSGGDTESSEPLYDEAVAFVLESRRASISAVQRKLRIGYNRAARLIEAMEQAGVVSPMNGQGGREVLVPGASAE